MKIKIIKMKEDYNSKLENKFTKIKGIKYLPYIGSKAAAQEESILIIGESVYNWGTNPEERKIAANRLNQNEFVRNLIYEHGIEARYSHKNSVFFRNLEKVFSNPINLEKNRTELWHKVAFHELVQRPLENSKDRPTREDYQNGAEVLTSVLEVIKPSKCVFLGTSWDKYKPFKEALEKNYQIEAYHDFEKINGAKPKIIEIKKLKVKIYFIKHPSQYFSSEPWKYFIENN